MPEMVQIQVKGLVLVVCALTVPGVSPQAEIPSRGRRPLN